MILQALTEYYTTLAEKGQLPPFGWAQVKVSLALYLRDDGSPERMVSVQTEQVVKKKTVLAPRQIMLPAPVKRSSGIAANFLCDNAAYILGVDSKGKPERARKCFAACRELHEQILAETETPAAKAVIAFFRSWNPETAETHPLLAEHWKEISEGANLVFGYREKLVHEDGEIREAWDRYYRSAGDGPEAICLITGEKCKAESVHPAIKKVKDAQSSGAALVSFNTPAACSYGKEQNLNAPTGRFASFAYTTALNHLLADREHVSFMGDATVVCWAKNGSPAYQDVMNGGFFDQMQMDASYVEEDIQKAVKSLCMGRMVDFRQERLDPNMEFYILGLSPNAARISVRFFLRNTFGGFLRNIQEHNRRMEIARPAFDELETLSVRRMLFETVNINSRDKKASAIMVGEIMRSILGNTRYPATMLNGVNLRIRAEHRVSRGRAAMIKAYYLKNTNKDVPEEVLTVSLNKESKNVAYNLGRLFAVLEALQSAANPGINATIKDKYFNSASAIPGTVFPILLNLAQKHLKKLDARLRIYYDKQLTEILGRLEESYPKRMNLAQQGSFQLGYYHQTQERYIKNKEEN